MIPKIIHYCWFGGALLSETAQRCIASWKKFCPDYEIREWNEDNFDIDYCAYVREAYQEKKWAFITDVVRLYALVNYGGIYMDTDVEVIRPLDGLLKYDAVSGFESISGISTGLMASRAGHPLMQELLHEYDLIHFRKQDGSLDYTTNVCRITETCQKYGLRLDGTMQTVKGFTLLPQEYLSPKIWKTGEIRLTANTLTIHHFEGSWQTEEQKLALTMERTMRKYLPNVIAGYVSVFCSILKLRGLRSAICELIKWVRKKVSKI